MAVLLCPLEDYSEVREWVEAPADKVEGLQGGGCLPGSDKTGVIRDEITLEGGFVCLLDFMHAEN